ncbi:helix-turn-helix transcriptional regulator [Acinetobacter junii]|uniref:helix-turn-helix transcriptional regulator n=1 Tax=Acinetobacter junii TaxID=40215 RepID=UPI0012502AD9|nr:AlpA family phage regulatory protein [Acinetobacter junii]
MQSDIYPRPTILRLKEVIGFTGVSRSVIYEKLNKKSKSYDPSFPKPIKLSLNAVGWFEHEIIQWLELKAEQRFTC